MLSDIQGLSRFSLLLETLALSVTFSYFSANGYPAADYLEYPLLLAQNVALFAMAFYFDSTPAAVMAAAAVAYFAPLYLLSQGILGASAVQLAAVRKTKRCGGGIRRISVPPNF